ncbi:MAG: HAD family phosphatase [Prevotella sp.]|jgi:HAD superfamily hydrolase (TIGR01509 family)|uniref:HAD family hydrolase n=1 Tax=Prevotella sp. TaxID=59823 RepID=UPI00257C5B56|nr:HAD family phosphatase [Prevotella sp.]MBS5874954.1 HAD family phosphatase [Prevotella sp.]
MERVIKNIVFDLGGVIMTLDPAEALRRFKALGLSDAERYLDAYTQSGIFGNLEEGKITAEDFRSKLSSLTGHELTFDECKHAWLGYRKDVPQRNLDLLKELRAKGYRLILLSNTNPFMMDWALSCEFDGKGSSLNDYFDALYLSYRLGIMKPAPDFFRQVLDNENILPEETLFVDDGPRNVEAAGKLGFMTMCPDNGSDWTGELRSLLHL